jgi:hypothetical protein
MKCGEKKNFIHSKDTLVAAQLVVMSAFIGFTAMNWRCPSCNKYLGMDSLQNQIEITVTCWTSPK